MPKLIDKGLEEKFIVFNAKKIDLYCNENDLKNLEVIANKINNNNEYIVINLDEPYADEIINVLKKHNVI